MNHASSRLPLVGILVLLLSGCFGQTAEPLDTSPASPEPRYGNVSGLVTDDEGQPVGNATVALEGTSILALTDDGGRYEVLQAAEGNYDLVAAHPEYETVRRPVAIVGETTLAADVTMIRLPAFRPFNLTTPHPGQYTCAMEALIIPGSCGIVYENATCRIPGYCQPDPFEAKYDFKFEVGARWESVVLELVWEGSASNALDGMRLYLEDFAATAQAGHSVKIAREDGTDTHLMLRVHRGQVHPTAENYPGTETKAVIPDLGAKEQVRVFPMGKAWDVTRNVCHEEIEGCLLGVGVGVDVQFTVYITIFYNEAAPQGFRYITD